MDRNYSIIPELVYINWPFVYTHANRKLAKSYSDAVCTEIDNFLIVLGQRVDMQVLYFGGGAIDCLPEAIILDISGTLRKTFNFNNLLQGTIEVNLRFFDKSKIVVWQKLGINRLVIGIYHYMQPEIPIEHMRNFFSIIALACTICITPETIAHWKAYIKKVISWPIQQISLSFIPTRHVQLRIDFYYWLREFLLSNGMYQYELYGFEFPNHSSMYMKGYLQRKTLKGFGAYAESFDGVTRYRNEQRLLSYIEKVRSQKNSIVWSQTLSAQDARLEKIMLGLRLANGVSLDSIYAGCSQKERARLANQLLILKEERLIIESENAIALAPAGLVYEQEILLKLVI